MYRRNHDFQKISSPPLDMFSTQNFATFAELKCEKILGTEFKIFDWWLQGSISKSADSVHKLPLHNYPDTCPHILDLGSCISS